MPPRPSRPCNSPGCKVLVTDGTNTCATHKPLQQVGKFADKARGTRTERGYGYKWVKLRSQVLKRDCGLCQPCMRAGTVRAAKHVDHIKPKFEGGTDDVENLQAICVECHTEKTLSEAARGR